MMDEHMKFLKNVNDINAEDVVLILQEDRDFLYYMDNTNRLCIIEKGLEGVVFERID